jgi:peptide/nickel transport system permease protein
MATTTAALQRARKSRSAWIDFLRRLVREKPMGTVGGVIVLLLLMTGIFANFLAPGGYNTYNLFDRLKPPSASHWLGTDQLGRDELHRIIYGARVSMIIGLGASAIATAISAVIALASGYLGGTFDIIVQRFVDAWLCFPSLILLLSAMALVGPGVWQVTVVLGIASGIGGSRIVRSAVIGIRANPYIDAAKSVGASTSWVIRQHLLPNIVPFLVIYFTVSMAGMILAEAGLSFLGFGIPPPFPSWGGMLSLEGRTYMLQAPWLALWPGLSLSVVVYGVNMFGDAVRDLLDPRLRGGVGRYGKAVAAAGKR